MKIEDIEVGKQYLVEVIDLDGSLKHLARKTVYAKANRPNNYRSIVLKPSWYGPGICVFPENVVCEAPKRWYQFWK